MEAAFYLDQAEGDVTRAVALQRSDKAWEDATELEYSASHRANKMALASAISTRVGGKWSRGFAADAVAATLQKAVGAVGVV